MGLRLLMNGVPVSHIKGSVQGERRWIKSDVSLCITPEISLVEILDNNDNKAEGGLREKLGTKLNGKSVLRKETDGLKVGTNEKVGGSGRWQMLSIGLGLW